MQTMNDSIKNEIEKLRAEWPDGLLTIWVANALHIDDVDAVSIAAAAMGYDVRRAVDADDIIFFRPPRVVRAGAARFLVFVGGGALAEAPEFPMAEMAQEWIDKKFQRITDGKLYPEYAINPALIDRE